MVATDMSSNMGKTVDQGLVLFIALTSQSLLKQTSLSVGENGLGLHSTEL